MVSARAARDSLERDPRDDQDGIAAAVLAGAAAAALDLEYGLTFAIDFDGAVWRATRRDGTGTLISALNPGDLAVRLRAALGGSPW